MHRNQRANIPMSSSVGGLNTSISHSPLVGRTRSRFEMECGKIVGIIFIFIHLIGATLHICSIEECICEEKSITCRDKDPQWYYIEENSKYTVLDFRYCAIEFISPGYFEKFKNLKTVDIRHQSIYFDCKSIPKKRSYILTSNCDEVKTTKPTLPSQKSTIHTKDSPVTQKSTIHLKQSTHISSTQRDISIPVEQSSEIMLTSTRSLTAPPTTSDITLRTPSIGLSSYFSNKTHLYSSTPPELTNTENANSHFSTPVSLIPTSTAPESEDETILYNSSSVYTDTSHRMTSTFTSGYDHITNSTIIKKADSLVDKSTPRNEIVWASVSSVMILITISLLLCIAISFYLRRRRLRNQMNRLRFNNDIYMGNLEFDHLYHQMLHSPNEDLREPEEEEEEEPSNNGEGDRREGESTA